MKKTKIVIAIISALFIMACSKPGPGGKASISLEVKVNKLSAPAVQVYLKYDAKNSPGTNEDDYDQVKVSNAQGEVYFTNLQKGDYYVYATVDTLSKGQAYEIKDKIEVVEDILLLE